MTNKFNNPNGAIYKPDTIYSEEYTNKYSKKSKLAKLGEFGVNVFIWTTAVVFVTATLVPGAATVMAKKVANVRKRIKSK